MSFRNYRKIPKGQKTKTKFPCEICEEEEYLQTHHIRGRDIPNANAQWNLCLICVKCHTSIHEGEIIVEDWIMTTGGNELVWHKKGDDSFSGNDADVHVFKQ